MMFKQQLNLLWVLASKDIQLFLVDKKAAALCFLVPIILASGFGYVFSKPLQNEDLKLPLLIIREDNSPLAIKLADALLKSTKLEAAPASREEALRKIERRSARIALIIPKDFASQIALKKKVPAIEILHHPSSSLESKWAEGIFTEIAFREAAPELLGFWLPGASSLKLERPFEVKKEPFPTGMDISRQAYSHSFSGMTMQYLLFWGMDCGLLLLRERRQGIWKRLKAAPIPIPTLLGGKIIATALIALTQILFTFSFGSLVFGVTINGSILGFLIMAIATALLSAATGLLIAAVGGTENRARSMAILSILSLSILGGLWLPSFMLPLYVQNFSLLLPTTWMIKGFEGVIWQGMGLIDASYCALVTLFFSAIFIGFSILKFQSTNQQSSTDGVGSCN
ncbi:MAG: ABC transporter permease [Gemmataceae bacterium]|nr:ABC transporter permease [Gemmataceae bacterium]MBJ7343952.1 ABC transporter permease [Gemmataceae bacterium]MBJ7432723.1 ABC transporter permease [Gemmataceae bacterium]